MNELLEISVGRPRRWRTVHLMQDIAGGILAARRGDLDGVCTDSETGKVLTRAEVIHEFQEALKRGERVMRMCPEAECPDFDVYGKGCPGHAKPYALAELREFYPNAQFGVATAGALALPWIVELGSRRRATVGRWCENFDDALFWLKDRINANAKHVEWLP